MDEKVRMMTEWIERANEKNMKLVDGNRERKIFWWNEGLAEMRRVVRKALKLYQRAKKRVSPDAGELQRDWAEKQKECKTRMKAAKENEWQKFVSVKGNSDPWGEVYKICRGKRRNEVIGGITANGRTRRNWKESMEVLLGNSPQQCLV